MKPGRRSIILAGYLGASIGLLVPAVAAQSGSEQQWTKSLESAAIGYAERLQDATDELVATRDRMATERVPLEKKKRETEAQVVVLTQEATRGVIAHEQAETRKAQLRAEMDGLNRSLAYITSLARDAIDGFDDALLPAESERFVENLGSLNQSLQDPANTQNAELALAAAELITARIERTLGGDVAQGSSLLVNSSELVEGTFAWIGPEVFFLTADNSFLGTVRAREGAATPVAYELPHADLERAAGLFRGERGWIPLDPSGGKALRLQEVRGTWEDHIKKGGIIGYIILALGGLAVLTTVLKFFDIRQMQVDASETIDRVLGVIRDGAIADAEQAVSSLCPVSRELFQVGLRHLDKPKAVIEDHLYAALLRLRMRVERRLPFLTVIVAAAPLLGLLGTVTGMIKTFTLINVFGTGNAAKLSSGISEALVTTELGLMVAIPTLVVHGYLNRSAQKNLSQVESYAAEFVAAIGERQQPSESSTSTPHE